MHFGTRCNHHADEEGDGIISAPMPQVEGKTIQLQIINNVQARHLNHAEPNLRTFDKTKFNDYVKDVWR